MKRLFGILLLLSLLCLAGCLGLEPEVTDGETEADVTAAEETTDATTAAETDHVHTFDQKVQTDEYLKATAACGEKPVYYYSCECGERGDNTFKGDPVPHLYNAVTISDTGLIQSATCTRTGCSHVETLNLQIPNSGTMKGAFKCSENKYKTVDCAKILYYENCTESHFENVVRWLQSNGLTQQQSYKLGNNRYVLYKGDYFTAYLSYLASEGAVRLYVGRADDLIPSRIDPGAGDVTPALWQINVDCKAAGYNGGMSYVLQLSDGKFIVVDGGYDTKEDAKSIYQILMQNKPANHEQPIIAGWFITHLHIDHIGALRNFTNQYKGKVKIEGFYYNFPYVNVEDIYPSNNQSWEELMASWEGATLYRKLHSGMQFAFSGTKITVLCTFEDVYPLSFNSGNDTSTVFKVEIAGQKIVFLGDAEFGESDRMLNLPSDVLKADIMQYAHHGYENQCRSNLYQKINPAVILWPMPFVNWQSDSHGEVFRPRYETHSENAWARTATSVKKIIVMAEGTTKLELPYTPTGPRNADYWALYQQQRPQ